MRRETAHRSKCLLPALPELHALRIVARNLHVPRSAIEADPPHRCEVRRDTGFESVELDEKNGLRIPRIARGINGIFHHADRRTIHELQLSLIHISEPTRLGMISYAVFC